MGDEVRHADSGSRRVTFLGRGLGVRSPTRLTLLVCPLCSQRNGERTAESGTCVWCGYAPAARDEVPCGAEGPTAAGRGEEGRTHRFSCETVPIFNK